MLHHNSAEDCAEGGRSRTQTRLTGIMDAQMVMEDDTNHGLQIEVGPVEGVGQVHVRPVLFRNVQQL
jgi:hypothetical protein